MSGDLVVRMSDQIADRALDDPVFLGVHRVALYAAIRNEVLTGRLFAALKGRGIELLFPRVFGEGIEFAEVDRLAGMIPGRWGIPEPVGMGVRDLAGVDLVVVPGVGFDEEGYRLGFGKGFYDRCLGRFEGPKVGLAYDFQVVGRLPRDPGDLRCDRIFTEKRVISPQEM